MIHFVDRNHHLSIPERMRKKTSILIAAAVIWCSPVCAQVPYKIICNQSETGLVEKSYETRVWNAAKPRTVASRTALVVSTSPFVLEELGSPFSYVANVDKAITSVLKNYSGLTFGLFVNQSERDTLKTLKFRDRITFSPHQVTFAAQELAMGVVVADIRKSAIFDSLPPK